MLVTPPPVSPIERVERAGRWLDAGLKGQAVPPLIALIGLGDGAVLEAIARRSPGTRVLALEPDPRHARAFLSADEWRPWRESGRLLHLADPDYAGADQAWRLFPAGITSPIVIVHPELAAGDGAMRAAQALKRIVHGVAANAEARRRFAPAYLVNSLRNLPAIAAGGDVRDLTDAYRGVPAIVLGAGPSLDDAIAWLRTATTRGLIVAADTALRPLLAAGIVPHLVAGLDPGALNTRHFLSLPECAGTWLIAESALHGDAAAVFGDRTLWFRAAHHHPWPWFNELGIDTGLLDVWGSVLTAAFQAARLAGCDPIVFAGADLSYPGGRPYARATTYEFDWAHWVAAGGTLQQVWARTVAAAQNGEETRDLCGERIRTSAPMISVRDWIVAQAARSGRRVINASGSGILYGAGIEQSSMNRVLKSDVSIAPVASLVRRRTAIDTAAIAARARDAISTLRAPAQSVEESRQLLSQWIEFTCGGFDAAAVAEALDGVAREIETSGAARAVKRPGILPWDQPGMAAPLQEIVTRLAEIIGKRMSGELPIDRALARSQETHGRPERLLQAWTLLGRICEALVTDRTGPDLRVRCEPEELESTPLCNLFDWPDPMLWAIVMFQALAADAEIPPVESERRASVCDRRMSDGIDRQEQPHPVAACACALLALEWLREAGVPHELCATFSKALRQDLSRLMHGERIAGRSPLLSIDVRRGESSPNVDLRLSFNAQAAAAMRTGTLLRQSAAGASAGARVACDLAGIVRLARLDALAGLDALSDRIAETPRVAAQLLTGSDALRYGYVSYATREGVVCVTPRTRQSLLLDRSGAVRPHLEWPRAIAQELPFGGGGAVAWANGLANGSETEPAYVMYRNRPDGPVTIEELPIDIRPANGCSWNGRVYWICRSRLAEPHLVVSWAPGEEVREEASGITALALLPEMDGIELHPCDFQPLRGYTRIHAATGWKLRPGQPLDTIALGPWGSVSSRARNERWTASAHMDSDVIRLEAADGRAFSLVCPVPLTIAWLGDSLIVNTLHGEILRFEALEPALDAAS